MSARLKTNYQELIGAHGVYMRAIENRLTEWQRQAEGANNDDAVGRAEIAADSAWSEVERIRRERDALFSPPLR